MTDTADRPRQRSSLDRANELLCQIYAEKEAADRANAVDIRRAHENKAHELGRQLIAETPLGDLQARRNAAAAASRTMIEPEAWHKATVDAGRGAVDPDALNGPNGAMQARNVLCRMLLDHATLLPPGLAHHTAVALYLITLGERDTWLTRRLGRGGVAHHVAFSELALVYYHAGFHSLSLEGAAAALFPADPSRWSTLEKFRTRHSDLIGPCEFAQDAGAADFAARRPYSCPFTTSYTVGQLNSLKQVSRRNLPRGKKKKKKT